ncbi:MAG: glycosyltransferase, partial [Gammaproteobacteria bacterium]|nr:glycosyltransferase [Gammaproteobacteria bacterium]
DIVAPLSPQLVEDSRNAGVKASKIVYVQNGVDLSEVDAQRKLDNPLKSTGDAKRIGFIGQMISRKNIFDILDVFDQLHKKYPEIRLILLGDGDQRSELEHYANKLESSDSIDFLGFRDDRLELLQSFDLFVMTSTLEGIPRCLMEACAMGTPVAAYNIAGIDQLITHQQSGLLANPCDKNTLMSYWEKLLFDRDYAKSLSDNGQLYVNQHYSAQRMANEYLDLFSTLVKGH